jgi:hypothetical protein
MPTAETCRGILAKDKSNAHLAEVLAQCKEFKDNRRGVEERVNSVLPAFLGDVGTVTKSLYEHEFQGGSELLAFAVSSKFIAAECPRCPFSFAKSDTGNGAISPVKIIPLPPGVGKVWLVPDAVGLEDYAVRIDMGERLRPYFAKYPHLGLDWAAFHALVRIPEDMPCARICATDTVMFRNSDGGMTSLENTMSFLQPHLKKMADEASNITYLWVEAGKYFGQLRTNPIASDRRETEATNVELIEHLSSYEKHFPEMYRMLATAHEAASLCSRKILKDPAFRKERLTVAKYAVAIRDPLSYALDNKDNQRKEEDVSNKLLHEGYLDGSFVKDDVQVYSKLLPRIRRSIRNWDVWQGKADREVPLWVPNEEKKEALSLCRIPRLKKYEEEKQEFLDGQDHLELLRQTHEAGPVKEFKECCSDLSKSVRALKKLDIYSEDGKAPKTSVACEFHEWFGLFEKGLESFCEHGRQLDPTSAQEMTSLETEYKTLETKKCGEYLNGPASIGAIQPDHAGVIYRSPGQFKHGFTILEGEANESKIPSDMLVPNLLAFNCFETKNPDFAQLVDAKYNRVNEIHIFVKSHFDTLKFEFIHEEAERRVEEILAKDAIYQACLQLTEDDPKERAKLIEYNKPKALAIAKAEVEKENNDDVKLLHYFIAKRTAEELDAKKGEQMRALHAEVRQELKEAKDKGPHAMVIPEETKRKQEVLADFVQETREATGNSSLTLEQSKHLANREDFITNHGQSNTSNGYMNIKLTLTKKCSSYIELGLPIKTIIEEKKTTLCDCLDFARKVTTCTSFIAFGEVARNEAKASKKRKPQESEEKPPSRDSKKHKPQESKEAKLAQVAKECEEKGKQEYRKATQIKHIGLNPSLPSAVKDDEPELVECIRPKRVLKKPSTFVLPRLKHKS